MGPLRKTSLALAILGLAATPVTRAQNVEDGRTAAPSEAGGDGAALSAPSPFTMRIAVIDAAPYGIDPVVGRHVTDEMRETAAAMGYDVLGADETAAAARALPMPYPPSPADLWRVTWIARVQRSAFARVWAHAGQYVVEIVVASLDGTGPFFARGTTTAEGLHDEVERLLRDALPPTERWDAEAAARYAAQQAPGGSGARPGVTPTPGATPAWTIPERPSRRERREIPSRRFDLVLQTEGAIDTSGDGIYNHLVGLRLGFRVRSQILLGIYVGYANLKGRDGRVSNVLGYLQIENRIRIMAESDLTVPIRLGVGFLPYNGPVVRLAGGLNVPVGDRAEVGFDVIAPTFWFVPNGTVITLDLAAELILRL